MDQSDKLGVLIVGASVRAAAFSAVRAGLRPWCADLFADADLHAACPVVRVPRRDYPQALVSLLEQAPQVPWIYTGALENRPRLVERLAEVRPLWGNGPAVLRRVRQPWQVESVLREAGLACPRTWDRGRPGPARGRWLAKPLAGAGGRGITLWQGQRTRLPSPEVYLQEFIEGTPCSAVYVGHRGGALLLGATRQLVGEPWLFASGYQYCGSIGPLHLSESITSKFVQLGAVCVTGFGLRGLFGIDCILRDGVPYPAEINPRYTASVEVLEQALGFQALALHRQACSGESQISAPGVSAGKTTIIGKAIPFAPVTLTVPIGGPCSSARHQPRSAWRAFADIPHAGQTIERGQPLMTVFAQASGVADCISALRKVSDDLYRLFLLVSR